MKKHFFAAAAVLFAAVLLTSCGSRTLEEQEKLKSAGIASLQTGDYESAAASFKEALGKSRYSVGAEERDLAFYLATADYLSGNDADALAALDALTELNAGDAQAYFLRGSLYLLEGENEKALSDYDAAIEAYPADYECYIAVYENLAARGQTDKAEEYLNKALGAGKDSAEDFLWRGKIYELQGQREAAESAYKKAADKGADIAALYGAQLLAEDGKTEDAEKNVSAYTKKKKAFSAEEYLLLATIHRTCEKYEDASKVIDAGLKADDADGDSRQNLMKEKILLAEAQLDFDAAYAAANDYIAAYPGDAAVMRELTFLSTRKS